MSTQYGLNKLNCGENSLTNLDVSNNSYLQWLYCHSNNLTSMDVSTIPFLNFLDFHSNNLTSLNVKNGNNSYFNYFDARNNIDLRCIQVNNVDYSVNNWPNIDGTVIYALDCSNLDITDFDLGNFRLYPNPASNIINIEFKNSSEIKKIFIYNSLGQLIIEENQTKIDVSKYSKGLYFIEITSSNGKAIKKFIIEE